MFKGKFQLKISHLHHNKPPSFIRQNVFQEFNPRYFYLIFNLFLREFLISTFVNAHYWYQMFSFDDPKMVLGHQFFFIQSLFDFHIKKCFSWFLIKSDPGENLLLNNIFPVADRLLTNLHPSIHYLLQFLRHIQTTC